MKDNLNLLIKKLIRKAFPEFSNKVTWTLLTAGIGILALPAPTYLLFVNGNDSNLLIVFYVQIMPDDFVMQLHRF